MHAGEPDRKHRDRSCLHRDELRHLTTPDQPILDQCTAGNDAAINAPPGTPAVIVVPSGPSTSPSSGDSTPPLESTGIDPHSWAILSGALLAAGILLLVLVLRRQRN